MRKLMAMALLTLPLPLAAQSPEEIIAAALDEHILPGYAALTEATATLAGAAQADCAANGTDLRAAYQTAFDAWAGVAHLTFGPAETDNRFFALAFWPDPRGATPRGLSRLIAEADPVVEDANEFATVSVASRGFYALEFLLYDETVGTAGEPAYRCALILAVTADIDRTARALRADWEDRFADLMRNAGTNDRFRSPEEALRLLFTSLDQGLEFTADLRLGRPLGTFDRPRAGLAEARRSGRSLRQVTLSLETLSELASILATGRSEARSELAWTFDIALERARTLEDPVFAGVADPQGRIRVEVLRGRIHDIRAVARTQLGPALGVAAGFNSLDGD